MDYLGFSTLRQVVWDRFEQGLTKAQVKPRTLRHQDLEALVLDYRQILHDHALAKLRFPGTGADIRLRRLALTGAHFLQRDQGERVAGLKRFFAVTFPFAFARLIPMLATTTALFLLMAFFGLALAVVQPALSGVFLPPGAIDGLREGRMWTDSLVNVMPGSVSSSRIATNNISVSLMGWAGGALFGLGSLWIVILNGFLLGIVFATTWHYGMAGSLANFVAAHGPLEISLILVSTAAGLHLGKTMITADDRPKGEAVVVEAKHSLFVVLGCLPWFVLLGLVEAFISPEPEVPFGLKIFIGIGLLILFLLTALHPLLSGVRHEHP